MREQYYSTGIGFYADGIDLVEVVRNAGFKYSFYQKPRTKNAFIHVVKGSLKYTFFDSEGQISINSGDTLFVPSGSRYGALYLEDATYIKIVQFDLVGEQIPRYLKSEIKLDDAKMGEIVDSFFEEKSSATVGASLFFLSRMYELLWRIDEKYSDVPKKYKKLVPALDEMASKLAESHPVAHYARLCNMSEVNFRRTFGEYLGMSPVDYRNGLRLTEAQKKLTSGEYNVTEAASSVGFSNLSFFIRLYKKKFGHTPKSE